MKTIELNETQVKIVPDKGKVLEYAGRRYSEAIVKKSEIANFKEC